MQNKPIIYQVFTRLFGSDKNVNQPNGDRNVNGCGTMTAFTPAALAEIKALGATHIWYTGIIEHATQTDYSAYGITRDHHAVVKGKAGSAYAIKDYYDVDPDIATTVPARMREFEDLLLRSHRANLKVIIDFVPNHVARQYHSDACPDGVEDLGAADDTTKHFSAQNNFYYFPGEQFQADFDLQQDEDAPYIENPARATGNDVFSSFAGHNDWYETVKLNYGVDPWNGSTHFDPTPPTWNKMLDILKFWAGKGVDGFRCDMAHMVPVQFWQWAISQIKDIHPGIIFIAEIYDTALYHSYLHEGGFDYLYDKVTLYDTLRGILCSGWPASDLTRCWQTVEGIGDHMLAFLENHDEQRIASQQFCSEPWRAVPALVVAATMCTGPFMLYSGQELGEKAADAEGFSGHDGRTTIFDYWSVPTLRRWHQGKPSSDERRLRSWYRKFLRLCNSEKTLSRGQFFDLMYVNQDTVDTRFVYAYLRHCGGEMTLVVANFGDTSVETGIRIPQHALDCAGMPHGQYSCLDLMNGASTLANLLGDTLLPVQVKGHDAALYRISATK